MNKRKIIQIGDKAYQNASVVMLPTEKESLLLKSTKGNLQFLGSNSSKNVNNHFSGSYQHLYILSDEEINSLPLLNDKNICIEVSRDKADSLCR